MKKGCFLFFALLFTAGILAAFNWNAVVSFYRAHVMQFITFCAVAGFAVVIYLIVHAPSQTIRYDDGYRPGEIISAIETDRERVVTIKWSDGASQLQERLECHTASRYVHDGDRVEVHFHRPPRHLLGGHWFYTMADLTRWIGRRLNGEPFDKTDENYRYTI